jgi:type II secretory pathway pseudopilin PulG
MKRTLRTRSAYTRQAYTLVEMLAASALTIFVMGTIATLAAWNFRDRAQHQARHIALEAANNVLEEARSLPWESLTAEWAKAKELSADPWLPDGALEVAVSEEANEKGLKRVTAKVSWIVEESRPRLDVELVGFFAPRPVVKGGEK